MKNTTLQHTPSIVVQPFQRQHQEAVKKLILDGLTEHWGYCDPTLNPDLNDNIFRMNIPEGAQVIKLKE